ncbi:acyl-CoA dehydrogenase family protein [Kaistia geumhonensis]|uniref:Acyl-CoA dehydrogenase n=1 Tax=Kaistia geumhonensis TaxID=410839 RepID=A0ABU0MAS6_9HYPH|nr:acyl-CoA dehydrogenase family protein [Kaistia geumhonensis]MCX5481010.1 acyl-CoA dehydrogenase family protein [Kaistia geumhonensis]MDQ0518067.1 putative acyl-CoA dehydrogenase [Kaistia geumhonensis]
MVSPDFETHEVANQIPPRLGANLYASDPVLAALVEDLPQPVVEGLTAHGAQWGSAEMADLARLANTVLPHLRSHDASGRRVDLVEFHPAWHALMRRGVAAGLHASIWDAVGEESNVRAVARAARLYMAAEVELGHIGPLSLTSAAVASLGHAQPLAEAWLPLLRSRRYDSRPVAVGQKSGALIGLATTEKQGGSDLRAATTRAESLGDGTHRLVGHKWFVSAPMSDALLVLAQTLEGLSLFLVPRFLPDGKRNPIRMMRLKDKLGTRSNAAAEIEFPGSVGLMVGEPGRGVATIAETVTLLRVDDAVAAAGVARAAVAEAVHDTRYRRAYGAPLIDQPLMTRVLADMALDVTAATALVFRLAEAVDRSQDDPAEAAFARLMTPAIKYWVAKIGPAIASEAMECAGGNGYVEEGLLARLARDAQALPMVDGPGNVLCLDVLRVLKRSPEPLEAVLKVIEDGLGPAARSTLNVLRAAAAVAIADEGSARILTEQLAMTVAAATLRRRFPSVIADAFLETRLGKPWRSTYGMLDARFDARAFVDYVFPRM